MTTDTTVPILTCCVCGKESVPGTHYCAVCLRARRAIRGVTDLDAIWSAFKACGVPHKVSDCQSEPRVTAIGLRGCSLNFDESGAFTDIFDYEYGATYKRGEDVDRDPWPKEGD